MDSLTDYLENLASLDTLRLITCGSVDDGKSTLIGRLLYDTEMLFDDQLETLKTDSAESGTQGGEIDFALLLDGLNAEREQGITIDIAWRFFATKKRRFIIADAPGHAEYTHNMATAASTASLAVLLIDAEQLGVREQTTRHLMICQLMGIKQVILAINKMDKINYDKKTFEKIHAAFMEVAQRLNFTSITVIPLSALKGDMVVERGDNLAWYKGKTLLATLESAQGDEAQSKPQNLRMPIQWVCRPSSEFRGIAGRIFGGSARIGDKVRILPSGVETSIASIQVGEAKQSRARLGESVMLTLSDEVSASRGDVIASAKNPPECADQFEVNLIWLSATQGLSGRQLNFKIGTTSSSGSITSIKHKIDIETGAKLATTSLTRNDIAVATIALSKPIAFEPYETQRNMGSFIITERQEGKTLAAGMIRFALRRATNIHRQAVTIGRSEREKLSGHRGSVYWFTGLSGAGKSTIANAFEIALNQRGIRTYLLDGDNIRYGLNRDLGFTDADRVENIRRVAETSRLMVDAGLVVLAAFISPFRQERNMARALFETGDFAEVFVDAPLEICEKRDPKGLYQKARAGEIPNFTGIDSPYEPPETPECHLSTQDKTIDELVTELLNHYNKKPS